MMWLSMACILVLGYTTTAGAQSKALVKDVKKEVKLWQKQGWSLLTGSGTLEYVNTKYRAYVEDDDDVLAIYGIAEGQNVKIGRDNAVMNGITGYATRASSQVVGKLKSLGASENSTASKEDIDKFGEAFQMSVNHKMSGLVKQHFVLVKEVGGKKEFRAYMSYSEKEARQAREEAAREAKEQARLQDLSDAVDKFIGEVVED